MRGYRKGEGKVRGVCSLMVVWRCGFGAGGDGGFPKHLRNRECANFIPLKN